MIGYGNPYMNPSMNYVNELQNMRDKIDNQIRQYQQNQNQQPQMPTNLTQNFQLAPNPTNNNELESKYANNIDEVKNTFVMKTGIFVNKDYSTMWIKDISGNIRTFNTEEVVELDDKDKEILMLREEIQKMKGMITNANTDRQNITDAVEQSENEKSSRVSNNKRTNAK